MPYKDDQQQRKADKTHERLYPGDIARLHRLDRPHYDTPGSVKECACLSCNTARRLYGARQRTWQGMARTTH